MIRSLALVCALFVMTNSGNADALRDRTRVYKEEHLKQLHDAVAKIIIDTIRKKPNAVIYLPTGSTPKKTYAALIKAFENDRTIDFSKVTFFNLDEYVGLKEGHPLSYGFYMKSNFYDPLRRIDPARAPQPEKSHIPAASTPKKARDAAEHYRKLLEQAGPADLALLGVGGAYPVNMPKGKVKMFGGHIAFNEPGTPKDQKTHVVTLTAKTRKDTGFRFKSFRKVYESGQFPELGTMDTTDFSVPTHAISMGTHEILQAKHLILIATEENKMPVIQVLFQRDVTPDFPVTYLKDHPNVDWFLDEAAASLVDLKPWSIAKDNANPNKEWVYEAALDYCDQKQVTLADVSLADLPQEACQHDAMTQPQDLATALRLAMAEDQLPQNQTIMILSPHPDDDVIGMSATIKALQARNNTIHIVYAVTGENAVRTTEPLYKTIYDRLAKDERLSDEDRKIEAKAQVREQEASAATQVLGVPNENLHFFRAEYYNRRGIPGITPINANDLRRMQDLVLHLKPTVFFFAAENDPHGAHGLSTKLLVQAVSSDRVKRDLNVRDMKFMGYRGAYNEWQLHRPDGLVIVTFGNHVSELKENAIKSHVSQLDPLFPSFDPDPFYLRARKRNQSSLEQLKAIGITRSGTTHVGAELFMRFTPAAFVARYG